MQILPGSTPGSNAGGTALGAPEVSGDLAGIVRPGPASLELPACPHGWTPAAWDALRSSVAVRQANRIHRSAAKLLDDLRDFPNDHGPDCDLEAVLAAGQPLPSSNPFFLRYVRDDFTGFAWVAERFLEAVRDSIPEPLLKPKPETEDATPTQVPPAPEAATGFEAHHARRLREHPEAARRLDAMTAAERTKEMARLRRHFAYLCSPIHRDGHEIYRLADALHDKMTAFVASYSATEGEAILKAAGLAPPPADADEAEPAEVFEDVFNLIRGTEFSIGLFLSCAHDVSSPPPDRKSDATPATRRVA